VRQITHISPEVVKLLHHLVLQESDSYKRINLRLNSMNQQIQSPAIIIRIELKFEAKDEEYKYHNARTFYNKNKIGKTKNEENQNHQARKILFF
jgi:NADH:ubiquinone oxidoreductase subunit D